MRKFTVLELCAGAGGQALGFEAAGYDHVALLEIDKDARETLKHNRKQWNVVEDQVVLGDITRFDGSPYCGITDVLAAGLPCPPWSKAGKQLGEADERNLFPAALRIIGEVRPKAILIENVSGILDPKFADFREDFARKVEGMGYKAFDWKVFNASDFGVSQLRPRAAFVAVRKPWAQHFKWPQGRKQPKTVGELLFREMSARGWKGAAEWRDRANAIAPTLVGGSKKHGGPDLGPTRAKREWAKLGVNGHLLAVQPPDPEFIGDPHLTVRMAALVQGFPESWEFRGAKTSSYRQVGNAFPPPVAEALARSIRVCLAAGSRSERSKTKAVSQPVQQDTPVPAKLNASRAKRSKGNIQSSYADLAAAVEQENGPADAFTSIIQHETNPFAEYEAGDGNTAARLQDGLSLSLTSE